MVELTDVDKYLTSEGLGAAHLPFLSTEPGRIAVLIFQPKGNVIATTKSLRVEARDELTARMKGFMALAKTRNVNFAACAEYSCPWPALVESVRGENFPPRGALWSICCESITPEALNGVTHNLQAAGMQVVAPSVQDGSGQFMNLLCHLFWVIDAEGNFSRVALLQAKTSPMGGIDFERDSLICGQKIFRFGVEGANRLVCLICSDALGDDFRQTIVNQLLTDTLIIHLQLNKNPSAAGFREYRDKCCTWSPRTTEILSVNWATGTQLKVGDQYLPFVEEPKTIYYRPKEGLNDGDEAIIANDKIGCYTTNLDGYRSAAYVFHPDEHLYEFRTSKPRMAGSAAVALRTGVKMLARYEWISDQWLSATTDADDGFDEYLAKNPDTNVHVVSYKARHVDVERLMQFATGYVLDDASFTWQKLRSFQLETDDTSSRMRLCWSIAGAGASNRHECQVRFKSLVGIIDKPSIYPARLSAFKSLAPSISYNPTPAFRRFRNLVVGETAGTVMYLGTQPHDTVLKNIKNQLEKRLYDCKEDPKLLSLLYRDTSGTLIDYMDNSPPLINDDPGSDPTGISTV